uniref:Lipase n=2 Tax=Acrobeloides nanus TaxID=290746 RepID=A0A914CDX3_9BILA
MLILLIYFLYNPILYVTTDEVIGPLTKDFQNWLNENGYEGYNFSRPDLGPTGSYGGRAQHSVTIKNDPIVFIHGNSDGALAIPGNFSSGWTDTIEYFLSKGYTSAELYATTWGDRNPLNALGRTHSCETLTYLKQFTEAVLKYTGHSKVDVISHSMGVTVARKVVIGGMFFDENDTICNLGPTLTHKIDTFIGLAGANLGMCECQGLSNADPTCNKRNGFWPGDNCGENNMTCPIHPQPKPCNEPYYSDFLTQLNTHPIKEASYVYSTWSLADDIVGFQCLVYGRNTSLIPLSDRVKVYRNLTHMETKECTVSDQYDMIVNHYLPSGLPPVKVHV